MRPEAYPRFRVEVVGFAAPDGSRTRGAGKAAVCPNTGMAGAIPVRDLSRPLPIPGPAAGRGLYASPLLPGRDRLARLQSAPVDGALRQGARRRSEEHTSELQSRENLVCRLLLEKKIVVKCGIGASSSWR